MVVTIGSARIDERGKIKGGQAGDQSGGKEVSTQSWYKHSKGWRVFRAKSANVAARIAAAMRAACDNDCIGYDQDSRSALWSAVKSKGYDPAKAVLPTETDCSALVRVCCAYAGVILPDFNTSTEAQRLLESGAFSELSATKYQTSADYLAPGDILVTKTKGHTAVVLTRGSKAEQPTPVDKGQIVTITEGTWNVRKGPAPTFAVITTVHCGETYRVHSTDSASGWYRLQMPDVATECWVSNKAVVL